MTRDVRGKFPNPRPLTASYNFGWDGVVAATGEIEFGKSGDELRLRGQARTIGLVHALWTFEVDHRAFADARSLQPISLHQVEQRRNKTVTTDLSFRGTSVTGQRDDSKSRKPPKPLSFTFPGGVFDMHSALLFLRSQPLRPGDVYRLVVYPASSAYLATLQVEDREPITVDAGTYPAIKLDVHLDKIGKKGELEPHKKFRRASVWVSDDSDRMLLRVEASIFVGTVFAELQSIRYTNPAAKEKPSITPAE